MIELRLAHLEELRNVAEQEGVLAESQWWEIESIDMFYNSDMFEKAKTKVQTYKADLPFDAEHHKVHEAKEAIEKYRLASDTLGCISSSAGAIHPYQFVTGIFAKLLSRYPDHLSLCVNTPCTSISPESPPTSSNPYYTLSTPRGTITTPHIIHATNGWASTLLEKFRGKIIPFRGNMTAQRPGQSLPIPDSNPTSHRSFIYYTRPIGYEYLTQLPTGEHELMLGGRFAQDDDEGYEAMGNTDDTTYSTRIGAHLSGVLPKYFGENNWGREGVHLQGGDGEWAEGRVKALWSGILGISVDLIPWVGRLPRVVSGRSEPPLSSVVKSEKEKGVLHGGMDCSGVFGRGDGACMVEGFEGLVRNGVGTRDGGVVPGYHESQREVVDALESISILVSPPVPHFSATIDISNHQDSATTIMIRLYEFRLRRERN